MSHFHVYLASASPRRRELLDQVGINYSVIKPEVDESKLDDVDPLAYTQRIAISKALFAQHAMQTEDLDLLPIIAADTAVVLDHAILGKPENRSDAFDMLSQLSGRTHQVFSSICVINGSEPDVMTQISEVTFRSVSQTEIFQYWASGEPADKAGAYGIQGLGAKFIKHLNGSYSGVMGLPLFELTQLLAKLEQ